MFESFKEEDVNQQPEINQTKPPVKEESKVKEISGGICLALGSSMAGISMVGLSIIVLTALMSFTGLSVLMLSVILFVAGGLFYLFGNKLTIGEFTLA